jgi:hypothetical protein
VSGLRSLRPSVALLAPLFAACAAPAPAIPASASAASGCSGRVVLTLHEPAGAPSGTELARSLGQKAGVGLEFIASVGPNVFAFTLDDAASDANCGRALTRLRSDARVRSAELDATRKRHGS